MAIENRKVVLIGTGMVGMSYAYALLNQSVCDELVLIDINKERAIGEAMDLNHGLAFSSGNMNIYAGDYKDCKDAKVVVICAGVPQKEGESRLDLLNKNAEVFRNIIEKIKEINFEGIILVATNPVDVITRITQTISGFSPNRVIGSGTALDTGRLRYLLGDYFTVDPRNVHAYVIGEHGESEFVPWSQAFIATKSILDICKNSPNQCKLEDLETIKDQVKNSAQKIIKAKRSTYYGIGMALTRITKAILGNENSVLTVSAMLDENEEDKGVYIGMPCIVNSNGISKIIKLDLNDKEKSEFKKSCKILDDCYKEINL